jgi:hypothetical protein
MCSFLTGGYALETPRGRLASCEALLSHIGPQGARKLTSDQSSTGHESMRCGFSLSLAPLSEKEFAMSRNSRRCVCQTCSERTGIPSFPEPDLPSSCGSLTSGTRTLCIVCFRTNPVRVKLSQASRNNGEAEKRKRHRGRVGVILTA